MLVSVVIPCFNEQDNLRRLYSQITNNLASDHDYEIVFVDDGSADRTLGEIQILAKADKRVKYLSLSRNFGHQNALAAGINHATGDCLVTIDADGEQPPELITKMIRKWQEGYQVVYTIRADPQDLPFFKRASSRLFYRLMRLLSDVDIEPGAADFRLIDRQVVDVISNQISEHHLFLRGIIPWLGFSQAAIRYTAGKRSHGASKYTVRKMLDFALTGVTAFSVKPLRLSLLLGFTVFLGASAYGFYALYMGLFSDQAVSGWASMIISVLLLGGVQMMLIGIIGEYLGRVLTEVKHRPRYVVKDTNFS